MHILCLIDSLGSGGAQRQLVELAKGFKENGHDVSFLTYREVNFFKYELDKSNISVQTIVEPNYVKRLLRIRKAIRKSNPHAVLSFLQAANFMATLAGFPYRKWSLVVGERSANPNILKSFKLRFYRFFHLFADFVVANSHANMRIVRFACPFLSTRKCKVIYNIVDFEIWKPIDNYDPLPEKKVKVVVTASHRFLKNLNGLVEAVNLLTEDEKKRLQIDWYGDCIKEPYFDNSIVEAKLKIEQYGINNVFYFHEATPDINNIVSNSDCVGLFSLYEGLPNAVCEGMACAKLVIASNISDIPLLIKDSNFRFDPNDTLSICKSLKYVLGMKKHEIIQEGINNRQIALGKFNANSIIDKYLTLISI